ncbi:activating signal cointegrator 1 complex subunit 3 [Coemansia sp. Benny D115]|nr:activating signal cointegrator 1 complex subunit 3 [Coemansia sp. Benny D115]
MSEPRTPRFSDLLRLRDSRREALLDRREHQLRHPSVPGKAPDAAVAAHQPTDKTTSAGKGKGKGKGKDSSTSNGADADEENSGKGKGKSAAEQPVVHGKSGAPQPAVGQGGSLWDDLHQSIERERRLRRALLGLSATAPASSDEHQGCGVLAPMPEMLLHPDLSAHLHQQLQEAADRQMEQHDAHRKYSRSWLLKECQHAVATMEHALLDADSLCAEVLAELQSESSDNDIQGRLLELVGFASMDFLSTLISKRAEIVQQIATESSATPPPLPKRSRPVPGRHRSGGDPSDEPNCAAALGPGAELRKARARQLSSRPSETLLPASRTPEKLPHVYTSSDQGGNMLSMFGSKYSLPAGTQRDEFADHEEITVPIARAAPRRDTEAPVMIADMDAICQQTFRKYTSLNRIQSIIYPIAYGTNENMLLSAPTGAGKTDVALLTILRAIAQHCTPAPSDVSWVDQSRRPDITVDKAAFKIVYVAPMKALAAEVTEKYQSRLAWLGIKCRELTGDMQLTKAEVAATQIIVTTPEKWDVVTRKSAGDSDLVDKVTLLIIDEIHLLNEARGSVLEALIARTRRQVEARQTMIRLVGLSATLPNYADVAAFLGVNPYRGLFYFDGGFRPVPLEQHFVGVHAKPGTPASARLLNKVCYDRVQRLVEAGNQVMVFVHARKDTVKTAQALREQAMADGTLSDFTLPADETKNATLAARVAKSHNRELRELYADGFAIHHAGMLRQDRTLAEDLFAQGQVRVLCCTSTLAWGVNLPAYAVVIKGTQVYDSQRGAFVDLSVLDVLQIFGRAGRPQYESHGVGYILTTHDRLAHYVSAITMQHPIESKFASQMVDNLNAEVTLGTVTNVDEAVAWLGYTYLFIRMRKNPLVYGLSGDAIAEDPMLGSRRSELVTEAATELSRLQMIVFDPATGFMAPKDLGRIASAYYLRHESVEIFNQLMRPKSTEADMIALLCRAKEFDQIRMRQTEEKELKSLLRTACCCDVKGGLDSQYAKTSILLQAAISRSRIDDFSLVSDSAYVAQNGARLIRALFEIAVSRRWGPAAAVSLGLSKSIEKKMWPFEHPIKQFPVPQLIMRRLESDSGVTVDMDRLYDMDAGELGALVNNHRYGDTLASFVCQLPRLELSAEIAPITRNVLQITLTVVAAFEWNDRVHGSAEAFWIWVEDMDNTEIYHSENLLLRKRTYLEPKVSVFTIPVHEPLPSQIFIRAVSDRWIGAETLTSVSFRHLQLPEHHETHTDLLDLQPLPISALNDPCLEAICAPRFTHFNPVQTQIFHTLYHQPFNALVGAPTGSGKTIAAELAMWWAFREHPKQKVVYIAPLKALVKERVADWGSRLTGPMGRTLVEMTGDVTPDPESIRRADIIITTPEKWDGVSRAWHAREYVQNVSLVIIDEIHLLGGDRGPILEVIVSRMNHIATQMGKSVRIVGLSTALANARDLADWLGIAKVGLYNFRHSVRPVPLEIYIDGFPGRHYCPRMASMNRPAYRAIRTHSPQKPVIIFVSSRRQTRLTAQDLIAYCGVEENPRHFLHMDDWEIDEVLERTEDPNLRLSLSFGIGMHHAGLTENDRKICEDLFAKRKIQVLIATSTLAWGVNLPAHLVILKGTEFYDAKSKGYVDFPITDVLQMIGRAGRPQFDDSAVARIFVTDSKKEFYKKFLHEPFPVESSLHQHLHEHINAEIASGAVKGAQDAVDYLSWTYLYRRLRQNPTYYGVKEPTETGINNYLSHEAAEWEELPVRHNEDLLNRELERQVPFPIGRGKVDYLSPHAKTNLLLQKHMVRGELPSSDYTTDTRTVLDSSIRILQAMVDVAAYLGDLGAAVAAMELMQAIKQAMMPTDSPLKQIMSELDPISVSKLATTSKGGKRAVGSSNDQRLLADLLTMSDKQLFDYFRPLVNGGPNNVDFCCEEIRAMPSLVVNVEPLSSASDSSLASGSKKTPSLQALEPQTQYSLLVTLKHADIKTSIKKPRFLREPGQAYTPRFGKIQYEGWWVILAHENELLAIKRVSMQGKPESSGVWANSGELAVKGKKAIKQGSVDSKSARIMFITPETLGNYTLKVLVVSDAYLNLDRHINVPITVGTSVDQMSVPDDSAFISKERMREYQ